MLRTWNFRDEAANSTGQQVNRQKSARNLEVRHFDPSEPQGIFFDPKRNTIHTATLNQCDCNDFNLAEYKTARDQGLEFVFVFPTGT